MRRSDVPGTAPAAESLAALIALVLSVGTVACTSPREGYSPEQPIAYSHELHAGQLKMDCRYCHFEADHGRHAGVPSTAICMNCHSGVGKDKDGVIKLTKFWDEKRSIPWVKVHDLPDFVYFDHSRHLAKGFECERCHGKVEEMIQVATVYPFNMGWCVDCHRNPEHPDDPALRGSTDCSICHR